MKTEEKTKMTNIEVARYLIEEHGDNLTDEQLIKVAKTMGKYPCPLIRNYRCIVEIDNMLKEYD